MIDRRRWKIRVLGADAGVIPVILIQDDSGYSVKVRRPVERWGVVEEKVYGETELPGVAVGWQDMDVDHGQYDLFHGNGLWPQGDVERVAGIIGEFDAMLDVLADGQKWVDAREISPLGFLIGEVIRDVIALTYVERCIAPAGLHKDVKDGIVILVVVVGGERNSDASQGRHCAPFSVIG
jgi:hypothetical protein